MAGKDDDKKVKKTAKDGEKKVTKEKKDKDKDKESKKDKPSKDSDKPKTKKDKDSKDAKDKTEKKDKGKEKSDKTDKKDKASKPAAPQPRQPKKTVAAPSTSGDYLAGLDLPPSDEEEEYEKERLDEDEIKALVIQVSAKDTRKIMVKERKMLEKAAIAKAEALKDDDNVFDVAFEKQGHATDTLSATDIKVHNMTIRAKGKLLLENTTVTIAAGRRYGLVGPNGKGKSTLLRLIARRQIPVPENLDVLLVEQEVVGEDRSALEAVVAADLELMQLRTEEEELAAKLQETTLDDSFDADEASDRLNEIYERLQEIGSSTAESRASKILHGLGFTEIMQKRATNLFSGGWRMRISLARALYIQPTVLLLDEPTNHLDLRAVLWLEEYLMRWKKTLIVVSHDRDFLNSVTSDIIHLHDLKLHYYRGNFAQFEEMYEQRRREVNKEFEKYTTQLKAAKRSGNKANQDKVVHNAKKKQSRKQEQHQDDENKTEVPRQWSDYNVHFEFPTPTELPPPLIQLMDVSFKYPGREDFGLKDLNIGVDMGSRVAIVGPNGAGKTTLMNLLSGFLQPTHGDFRKSQKLRIGKYSQHFVDALQMDDTPVEYLLKRFPQAGLKPEDMRARLGRFGLSGHHHLQPICKLSGGQKARVVFTAIALEVPHILLLDEPTNHLDMQSIDALADAIEEFEGGVIIISHDSRLLSRVCDDEERSEVWVVEDGEVARYDGDFEDYKTELIKEIAAELDEDEREHAKKQEQARKK